MEAYTGTAEDNVVDNLWQAKRDKNVVDSFLTIEETLSKIELEEIESVNNAKINKEKKNQDLDNSKTVELIGYTENSSIDYKNNTVYHKKFFSDIETNLKPIKILPENIFKQNNNNIEIITEHQHPKKGEDWDVRFRTNGYGDLYIKPSDKATILEDEFIGLWCGGKKIDTKIIENDVIIAENWNCNDIATVKHKTLVEGKHTLDIELRDRSEKAYNGPNNYKVMGFFYDPVTTATFAGNASVNARQPDPAPGDLLLAVIALRPQTDIVTTPSGWTSLGSVSGTDGAAEGADTGSVRLYTMYKVATGSEGTSNQTFAETGVPSVWGVKIFKFRSASGTYDIATSSISINADTTAMGGTFSNSDLNLQSGDSILIASASNGDANTGYSGWAISASGASFGTVSEILDSNSTTGNDIRYGAAKTYVTSGTAQADPSVTITAAIAASGASSVIRIRQGYGANRSDTFTRSCGVSAAGSTSVAPVYPENEPGNLLLLIVGTRNSTVSPSTPANWTNIANYTGGFGTFGADAGNAKVQAFYRIPTTVLTGTQSVTITSGNTSIGQICAVHRDGAYNWSIDADGGGDSSPGTSWSVEGSGIDLNGNDGGNAILVGTAINTDTAITYTNHSISASGITFNDFNDTTQRQTSGTGNDMTFTTAHGEVSSGSATDVVPTFTMTGSTSSTNYPTGASIILAVHGNLKPYEGRRVRLISNKIKLNEGGKLKINQQ